MVCAPCGLRPAAVGGSAAVAAGNGGAGGGGAGAGGGGRGRAPAGGFRAAASRRPIARQSRSPGWAVRLAPASDQIALDHLAAPPPPAGKVFQLWLAGERGEPPQPLGLLPSGGRKIVAEAPAIMRRLPCA